MNVFLCLPLCIFTCKTVLNISGCDLYSALFDPYQDWLRESRKRQIFMPLFDLFTLQECNAIQSPCGHPVITDTRYHDYYEQNPALHPAKLKHRGLTENELRTRAITDQRVAAKTRVDCTCIKLN